MQPYFSNGMGAAFYEEYYSGIALPTTGGDFYAAMQLFDYNVDANTVVPLQPVWNSCEAAKFSIVCR